MEHLDSSYSLLVIGIIAIVAETLLVVPKKFNLFPAAFVLIIAGITGIVLNSFIIASIITLVALFNLHFIFRSIYSSDDRNNNKPFVKEKFPVALSTIVNRVPFVYRIFLLAILASVFFVRGGFFNPEFYYFLRQFQEDKPFLVKIFNDASELNNGFQAREFSYIVDFIDGRFFIGSARLGIVHFYSLSHYIGIFMIASLAFLMSKRYFGQKFPDISILISLLYLTTPSAFINGNLYRSSKILIAFFIVFIIYLLFVYCTKKIKANKFLILITFSAFLMTVSDKQGFFYSGIFAGIAGIVFLFDRTWKSFKMIPCFAFVCLMYKFYSDIGGPMLIKFFSGDYPSYKQDSSYYVWINSVPSKLSDAVTYSMHQFSYFFGNLGVFFGGFVAVALILSFFFLFFKRNRVDDSFYSQVPIIRKMTLFVPLLVLSSVVFIALMLNYSTLFLTAPDLRLTYYTLPITALILLLAQIVFARLLIVWPDKKKIIKVMLCVFFVFNAISIITHFDVYKKGFIKYGALATPVLKECIKQKDEPQKSFGLLSISQHADSACIFLRKRVESNRVLCMESPVYKCLSEKDGKEFENLKNAQTQKFKISVEPIIQ